MSFIFGGNTGVSYDEIQRKRAIADQLIAMNSRTPQNVGEGLMAVGNALRARRLNKQAGEADKQGRDSFNSQWSNIAGMLSGGGSPTGISAAPLPADPKSPQGIANDAMVAIGKAPDYAALESQYGLPEGYLARTAQLESGGNPNAQNPNSSAGGTFQFIDSTAKQYGLTDKFDPVASADAAARFARDNAQALRAALGREPTAAELYLAHQQGAGGAINLLQGGNNPAGAAVTRDALRFNGGNEGMTSADFANQWVDRFNGGQGGTPANIDLAQLAEIAGSPYASPGQKAVVQALIQQQMQAQDPAYQLDLQLKQAELEAAQNPTPKDPPQSFRALELQAEAAGLQKGTPEYQAFMLSGGAASGEGPAAFRALHMQAIAAGFEEGSPEYQNFMATRGAGLAAEAKAEGSARGEDAAQLQSMESKMQGLEDVVTKLDDLAGRATYTTAGRMTDYGIAQLGLEPRDSAVARSEYIATIDNQILPLLRDTFGAAFTQKEGETLRNTLGDPDKTPKEKQVVLKSFIEQKRRDVQALKTRTGADALSAEELSFLGLE